MDYIEIIKYLTKLPGFGVDKYSISKSKIMSLTDSSYLWNEKQIKTTIKNYVDSVSPLVAIIQSLINEINAYKPLFKYSFSIKVEEDQTLNGKDIWKASGRQYNKLASYRGHKILEGELESQRVSLLKRLGYDSEGYDISSTIWTTAKALITGTAEPDFDLKSQLVAEQYEDINGEIVTNRKQFKPLTQICFFCKNAHHAYMTYISSETRKDFEDKMGDDFKWPEFSEKTFSDIYYKCKSYIRNTNEFIDTIFFWESIWELSTILQCYKEGIAVLNVYDCFFLKDKSKYPRLKEIIKEKLEELINLYKNI